MTNLTIRIEGPASSGKTAIAAFIQRKLLAEGFVAAMPPARQTEVSNFEPDHLSSLITRIVGRTHLTILEDTIEDPRALTLEERTAKVQAELHRRGLKDLKITLSPNMGPRTLEELQEGIVGFMEAYLEGRYSPPTTIEIEPGAEPN